MGKIRSPFRYPGGKSRALKYILPLVPKFEEYREPFVGGGSVFIALKQLYPDKMFWINDVDEGVYSCWKEIKNDFSSLNDGIQKIYFSHKNNGGDGKTLYNKLKNDNPKTELDKAIRFFVMNRITFSGTMDSGGYSEAAFQKRFTWSSIERLFGLPSLLQNVKITGLDYENLLTESGNDVFIFLDPPYFSNKKSCLYGKNGDIHIGFDHLRLFETLSKSHHKWLLTYDDCEEVRELYKDFNIKEWSLQYGMNNYKQEKAKKGRELFISNY